jgi:hypothetical protein
MDFRPARIVATPNAFALLCDAHRTAPQAWEQQAQQKAFEKVIELAFSPDRSHTGFMFQRSPLAIHADWAGSDREESILTLHTMAELLHLSQLKAECIPVCLT